MITSLAFIGSFTVGFIAGWRIKVFLYNLSIKKEMKKIERK